MAITATTEECGNPAIQTHVIKNYKVLSGEILPEARIAYCVFGSNDKPVITLHPAVSGSPRAYAVKKQGYGDGWWSSQIGPGKMLDTERFRIICFSHFGGIGPSSTAAELKSFKSRLSITDTCHIAALALKENGEHSIQGSIGVSMGAAIAREWLFQPYVDVKHIVEVFGNFGNNYPGSIANTAHRIHYDVLATNGKNLDDIKRRINECFGDLCKESKAFEVAFDHVMDIFDELYYSLTERNVLKVARMLAYFRFLSPFYFQRKWDSYFNENMDRNYADTELKKFFNYVADSFADTFDRDSLACLRYMDAQPSPIDPMTMANTLVERRSDLLGVIVRGDRIYNPDQQIESYEEIRNSMALAEHRHRVKIYICNNVIRGHDHFLSNDFFPDAVEIKSFLES